MAYPTHNTSHVARGLSRLVSRYATATTLRALITAYLKEVQAVEDCLWDVLTLRNIQDGQGDQLTQIGKIVGQDREGLDDVGYRIAIGLRILANRSGGRTVDVLKIAQTLASNFTADLNGVVEYYEAPVFSFSVGVWNQTHPQLAASLLSRARASTSRGVMVYSTWPYANNLVLGSRYDASTGQNKLNSRYGGVSSPGLLVSARSL